MEFKKYPSIENSYRNKFIEKWVNYKPELLHEKYIITEKIHGANFSILITEDNVEYAKRTSKLDIAESFFGYQDVVKKYSDEFDKVQEYLKEHRITSIRLFGELFGGNIQKGIFYGKEKQIKLFDCYVDDSLLTQKMFLKLLDLLEIRHMYVPFLGIVNSLEEALEFNIEFNSNLIDLENNICEGVVIKPYENVYQYEDGRSFYLKKKNDKFAEKKNARKQKTNFVPSEAFESVVGIYKEYLNENRLDSIFSKYGEIEEQSQIGKYIKYILGDAKDDFMKDHRDEFLELEDKERGRVFKCTGGIVSNMLQQYL